MTDQKRTTRMPGANQQLYEKRLLRVLSYIYDHLDGDLSLDAMADVVLLLTFAGIANLGFTAVYGGVSVIVLLGLLIPIRRKQRQ